MSNRERWVVYPLIFFAFLMGARDKFYPLEDVACTTVTCNQLTIVASDGEPAVRITTTEDDAGVITVYACRLDPRLPGELIKSDERRRKLGHQAIELSANKDGGFMRVLGTRYGSDLYVGHNSDARFSGYAAVDQNGELLTNEGYSQAEQPSRPLWGLTRAWEDPPESQDRSTSTKPKSSGSE